MEYALIFAVIFFILLWVVFTRLVKGVLKSFFLVFMVMSLLMAVMTFFVYQDVANFQEGWQTQPKLFLLHDNDYLITGFQTNFSEGEGAVIPVNNVVLQKHKEYFSTGDLDKILGLNYKLFLIDYDAFSGVEKLKLMDTELTLDEVKQMLEGSTPADEFYEKSLGRKIELTAEQNEEFRSTLFGALFATAVDEQGPLYIVGQVKNGNMQIYPETAMFKVLRYVPYALIKNMFDKLIVAGEETAVTAGVVAVDYVKKKLR